MYELQVNVTKVVGECTADPPMKRGDYFTVRDGDIRIPEGGYVCLYAFQSILPLITPKEREICEEKDQDWLWRVQRAQCPDPKGRVIFKIEQVGKVDKGRKETRRQGEEEQWSRGAEGGEEGLKSLRVVVEEVKGKCTSGMQPGDYFVLRRNKVPAALIEVGYLSNTAERTLLQSASYQQQLAQAIAQGICTFYGSGLIP